MESLKAKIVSDPLGPGVPPLAIMCTDVQEKSKFKEHLKDVYNFAVICDVNMISLLELSLLKCYDHISKVYAYNKTATITSGILYYSFGVIYVYISLIREYGSTLYIGMAPVVQCLRI